MHLILSLGMAVLAIFIYRLQGTLRIDAMDSNRLFIYLVPLAALLGYFGGSFVYRKMLRSLRQNDPLQVRMLRFQSASLLHYACLEVAALVALYAYLSEGYVLHLLIAALLIFYLISRRPSLKTLRNSIPLQEHEEQKITG